MPAFLFLVQASGPGGPSWWFWLLIGALTGAVVVLALKR